MHHPINSRSIHSLNLNYIDSQRIAKEQAEILYKQNFRQFLKVENILYGKYENMEILTHRELESKLDEAFTKIVLEVEIN